MPPPGTRPGDAKMLRGKSLPPAPTVNENGKAIAWSHAQQRYVWASIGEGGGGGDPTLGGDLSGTASNATVTKVRGRNVPLPGVNEDEKFLKYDHDTQACVWAAPAVTLAGDVTGASGSAVVERVRGKNVPNPGAGEDERFLKYDHDTGAFVWATPPPTTSVTMGGDVSGASGAATVDRLKGKSLPDAPGAGQDRQVLRWNNGANAYEHGFPTLDDLSGVVVGGEENRHVLFYSGVLTAWTNGPFDLDHLGDVAISNPQAGHVLAWSGANLRFENQAPAGGAPTLTTVEVNLGSVCRRSGRFTIAGSGMTIGKPVMIQQASGPYTGKGTRSDEAEMDQVTVTGKVISATVIECFWQARHRVRGNLKFDFFVAG